MVERWHRAMKAAIKCHESSQWVDILHSILLGLRTSWKEDIEALAAELVYETTLRLPGEFFIGDNFSPDPQIFVEKFREQMRRVRAAPSAHHNTRKAFAHKTLFTCSHVFVRVDAVKQPCEQPYEGPFPDLERINERDFEVDFKGTPTTISTKRLKPAFFERENEQLTGPIRPTTTTPELMSLPATVTGTGQTALKPTTLVMNHTSAANESRAAVKTYPDAKKKKIVKFAT